MSVEEKKKILINIFFAATIIALLLLGIKYLLPIIVPFVIGLIVAIILQKPVGWLTDKTKVGRSVWSTILVILLLLFAIFVIGALGFYLVNQVAAFASQLQNYIPSLTEAFRNLGDKFTLIQNRLPATISDAIEELPSKIASTVATTLTTWVTSFAVGFASGLPEFLITFIFSILAGVFITSDYNKITGFILRQFKPETRQLIIKTKKLFVDNILKMARGYLIIMVIMFAEMLIALSILRVDYVVVLSLFIAIVDLLPVLGAGTVLVPWGIVAIILGKTGLGIGLLITYIIVIIVRNIIEPRIIGKQVGLAPLVTIIAMYIGLKLFGIFGLIIFPITVIILVKLQESGMLKIWK
ncbi:MAG: sporulation integral membrane protein YtvI [Acutalibacteraceae bacterium]